MNNMEDRKTIPKTKHLNVATIQAVISAIGLVVLISGGIVAYRSFDAQREQRASAESVELGEIKATLDTLVKSQDELKQNLKEVDELVRKIELELAELNGEFSTVSLPDINTTLAQILVAVQSD